MSCGGGAGCTCGCCAGTSVQTPRGDNNPPGSRAVEYRTGTWATFKKYFCSRNGSTTATS